MPNVRARTTYVGHLAHDVALVDLADYLLAQDAQQRWFTEDEVRGYLDQIAPSPHRLRGDIRHRPDGLLVSGDARIAIELEHSDKYQARYARISGWFVREWRVDRVRWYVDTPRILQRLREVNERTGVTYLGLPATAASEDVALVGRVLIQHLKQVAYEGLWSESPRPGLILFDEFASLGDAAQLVDLLLQAREARLAVVISTQQLPRESALLRKALLGAGVLIVHQVGAPEDADALARALGSRTGPEIARQIHLGPYRTRGAAPAAQS